DEMPAKVYAQILSRVLKRKITYNHIPKGRYASMGLALSCELADIFDFLRFIQADVLTPRAARQIFAEKADTSSLVREERTQIRWSFRSRTGLLRQMPKRFAKTSATNQV